MPAPYRSGISWSTPPAALADRVNQFGLALDRSLWEFAARLARDKETQMRQQAPWTDRTGAARRSLSGVAERSAPGRVRVVLGHGVEYGMYLEKKNAGRFAIVDPTIRQTGPEWLAYLRSVGLG